MATKKEDGATAQPNGPQFDAALIRELAEILNDTDLTEIEVESDLIRLKVARERPAAAAPAVTYAAPAPAAAPQPAASAPPPAAPADPASQTSSAADAPGAVTSPMVGTAYCSPSPGADPFVKVGDKVSKGQTLLIVEAMKTMNPIPAPHDGVVKEILFTDAQPVEYGEALMIVS